MAANRRLNICRQHVIYIYLYIDIFIYLCRYRYLHPILFLSRTHLDPFTDTYSFSIVRYMLELINSTEFCRMVAYGLIKFLRANDIFLSQYAAKHYYLEVFQLEIIENFNKFHKRYSN